MCQEVAVFSRAKTTVGLDIGSSAIKVVELESKGGATRLVHFGIADLVPEAIVEGEVMDRQLVVDTIQNLLEKTGVRRRRVAVGISGRGVIVKKITMDRLDPKDAREAIHWEAEQYVPYDINDVSLDFEILDVDVGPKQMQVLLVAAKKDLVNTQSDLIREAGLQPALIDVNSFAVQNAAELNYDFVQEETVVLLNVGAELTNVNIVRGGIPLYTQDLMLGGNSFIESIQKRYQVNREEAVAACRAPSGGSVVDIDPVVEEFGGELGVGIERSLATLKATEEAGTIDRILLSGGGARIGGLPQLLAERQKVPVDVVDPLRRITYSPETFEEEEDPTTAGAQLTVSVGLALRKAREK
ncbi:MAG: type IV pilus assembly protein PilM [Candidatus Eisenbacteria bacterium]|nr:type IV pilus assembly protein PilM [Candidatus Latescibacterota bacterium]MBD3302307.1 type IV pilus assembly protein PilM [Candidatus Eisenbacteria bacterium]